MATIGKIKPGAFHRWLGKKPGTKITMADIAKGKAAGGHAAKMATFAKNFGHIGEEVETLDEEGLAGKVQRHLENNGVHPDAVSRTKDGNVTVRKGFFYRNGGNSESWKNKVSDALHKAGVKHSIVNSGEHYAGFRGGDSVKQGSHWHTTVKLHEETLDETAKGHTIEAHGIRGMKGTPWRKTFKNHEHLNDWAEKNDSVEVHGTRKLDGMNEETDMQIFHFPSEETLSELSKATKSSYKTKAGESLAKDYSNADSARKNLFAIDNAKRLKRMSSIKEQAVEPKGQAPVVTAPFVKPAPAVKIDDAKSKEIQKSKMANTSGMIDQTGPDFAKTYGVDVSEETLDEHWADEQKAVPYLPGEKDYINHYTKALAKHSKTNPMRQARSKAHHDAWTAVSYRHGTPAANNVKAKMNKLHEETLDEQIKRGDKVKVRDASHHLYGKTGTVKTANSVEARNSGKVSHVVTIDGGDHRLPTNAVGKIHEAVLDESVSDATRELVNHADNNADLHRQSHMPIIKNLKKKMASGHYDSEKAKKLWGEHADRAAQSYHKEYGGDQPWHKMFTTDDRKQAATHWEKHHRAELSESVDHLDEAGNNPNHDAAAIRLKNKMKRSMRRHLNAKKS